MAITTIEKTSIIIDTVIPYAKKLFRRYGYKKTTVDDIASGIHISKKTLYSVFPSKEEILRETVWRETIEVIRTFNENIPLGSQSDMILLSLCRYIFTDRIKRGKTGYFWGLYEDDNDIYIASLEALKRIFKALYDDGSRKGIFKPVDSNFATEVIVSIITASLKNFHLSKEYLRMFNDTLKMIVDAVAYKNRINFEAFV